MNQRVYKDDQIKLIMECRQSGLSDYQWCEQNGVYPGTFYNWVSKLKKNGYTFPNPAGKTQTVPVKQEIVKIGLIECPPDISRPTIEQNATFSPSTESNIAAELVTGNITIRLFNGADIQLAQEVLRCIGGVNHAW